MNFEDPFETPTILRASLGPRQFEFESHRVCTVVIKSIRERDYESARQRLEYFIQQVKFQGWGQDVWDQGGAFGGGDGDKMHSGGEWSLAAVIIETGLWIS